MRTESDTLEMVPARIVDADNEPRRSETSLTIRAEIRLSDDQLVSARLTHSAGHAITLEIVSEDRTNPDRVETRRLCTINAPCDDEAIAVRELLVWVYEQLPALRAALPTAEVAAATHCMDPADADYNALYGAVPAGAYVAQSDEGWARGRK